jgi:hypothetical protein
MTLEREKLSEKAVTIKIKGKFVSALNSALRHEYIWGNGGIIPAFLNSTLDEGE